MQRNVKVPGKALRESDRSGGGRSLASQPRGVGRTLPADTGWGGKLILATFLLTIFEGAFRKWVFGGSPPLRYGMYFSKDLVFICAGLAGMAQARSTRLIGILLTVSLFSLSVPTLVNLPNTTAVGAILSIRAFLVLPVCAFLAGGALRSVRDLDRIAFAVGVSTLVVGGLGALQFSLPPTHVLNRYDTGEEISRAIADFSHVRATGTFSFISGMGIMAGVGGWAGIYLFLTARGLLGRAFATAVLFAGLCCGLVSMSRGGVVLHAVTVLGGGILFGRSRELIYLLLVFVVGYSLFGDPSSEESVDPGMQGAVFQRFEKRDSVGDRLGYVLMNLELGLTGHPFGEGLGRGQIGGNYAESGVRSWGSGYESELGRIGFEVGPLGWIGVVAWRVAAVVLMWRELRRAKDRHVRAALAASLPLFTLLALNYMAYNHTGSSFGWSFVALSLGAATLQPQPVPLATEPRTRGPRLARA